MTQIRLSAVPDNGSALRQNAPNLVNELFFSFVNEIWRWEGGIGRETGQEVGAALEVSVGRRGAAGGRAAC